MTFADTKGQLNTVSHDLNQNGLQDYIKKKIKNYNSLMCLFQII